MKVAPLVGAWIEIAALYSIKRRKRSLPLWERGLKLKYMLQIARLLESLPLWERGLKFSRRQRNNRI